MGDGVARLAAGGRRALRRPAFAAVVVALCAVAAPVAQGPDPDGPSVRDASDIVDPGRLQLEFGAFYQRPGGQARGAGSPVTVRVGVTDWLEARVGSDGLISQTDGARRQTGVGNTSLGAMLRVGAEPGGAPGLAILPTVVFPTADAGRGLGSGDRDYLLALLVGRDLGPRWHADLIYGAGRIGAGEGQPHFTQHLASVSVGVAATAHWNPYAEGFWFSAQGPQGGSIAGIDAGATYELGPRYAIEGGVEFGRSGASREVTVFAGMSMAVGDIFGSHGVHARQRHIRRRRSRS